MQSMLKVQPGSVIKPIIDYARYRNTMVGILKLLSQFFIKWKEQTSISKTGIEHIMELFQRKSTNMVIQYSRCAPLKLVGHERSKFFLED